MEKSTDAAKSCIRFSKMLAIKHDYRILDHHQPQGAVLISCKMRSKTLLFQQFNEDKDAWTAK